MVALNKWLTSGTYVFVIMSEAGYIDSPLATTLWPDAVEFSEQYIEVA
jgi:hypothetical protein